MYMNKKKSVSITFLCIILFSGCTVGSDYKRPDNATNKYKNYINTSNINNKHASISRWWERIDDPLLNHYIKKLLNQNLELIQAAERISQAKSRVTIQRADYIPTLDLNGQASRSFLTNQATNQRIYSSLYNFNLNSSWQIDLFGKIKRSLEAEDASYLASTYDYDALVHSLIADLVRLRVEIAVNKQLLNLARENAENHKKLYFYVKNQYKLGVNGSSPQNVLQAEDNYTSVQSDVHLYTRLLSNALYRFDILLGEPPKTTNPMMSDFPMIIPPQDVYLCLPANLLDRRPDLRSAELRVKAANADIGVAISDLYPSLNISGTLGFSGNSINGLFNSSQLVGSILGNITNRIFRGGALRSNIDMQKSRARELIANYANNILKAIAEVETNLKAEIELTKELENNNRSVLALTKTENIMKNRYELGIESFQDLLDTKRRLYASRKKTLNTQKNLWDSRVLLYLSLGGDWFTNNQHSACIEDINHDQ